MRPLQLPWISRWFDRLSSWRPGIAWQLGVAFIGVAALAAVANFAVQRTISITTTRVVPAEIAEVPGAVPPPAIARPGRSGTRGLSLLQRFTDAVQAAQWNADPGRIEGVRATAAELRTTLVSQHGSEAAASVDAALGTALGAVDAASRRRTAFEHFAATLAQVDSRLQESLGKAWKILGRVVARQALVNLDVKFEALRRHAEVFRDQTLTAADANELRMLEDEFATTLGKGEASLKRSLGKEPYERTAGDLLRIRELRLQLTDLDARRGRVQSRLDGEISALREMLLRPATVRTPRLAAPVRPAAPKFVLPDYSSPVAALALPWETASGTTTRRQARDEGIARNRLAWLSIGVLALLLVVSTWTVLSILRPVQRLIAASQRIALGESRVRVARAGSRELDRLSAAFNDMAANLEAAQSIARTYQHTLETRVAERTQELQHLAGHDVLTQLPNRRQLYERVGELIGRGGHEPGSAGLYFIDLDNFKNINDGMGHGFGDRVLVAIAARLQETIGDAGFASRFGGDEFTVLVDTRGGGAPVLHELGQALLSAFERPLLLDDREVLVSVSVGAAYFPDHADTPESLLRAADAALFRAKALGRRQLVVFTPHLIEEAATRFATEQGLRQAVDRGELLLVFQPEIDVTTLQVEAAEALLRWRTADGRMIPPDQFLSIAEESGLIIEISDWVMRSAIAAAARWRAEGLGAMRVAVNVSPRQLFDARFPDRVLRLLQEHALPPEMLEVELTESVLQTGPGVIDGLRSLQQMGVAVALDDFGTGYSSLASLEQLPLNRVKLDRSLVAGIDSSARSAAIANALIRLCRDIGVKITAEGVERCSQLAALRDSGVVLQGFLLAHPQAEAHLAGVVQQLPARLESLLLAAGAGTNATRSAHTATVTDITETQKRRRLSVGSAT